MAGNGHSPARMALSSLPGWVTVLGIALVLGEFAGGAARLAARADGGPRTVVLQVTGAYDGDSATYTTPTGDGQFEMSADTPSGEGGYLQPGPIVTKTVTVQAGGTVTISTFSGYGKSITCSIYVNHKVISQIRADGFWSRGRCRAKIP